MSTYFEDQVFAMTGQTGTAKIEAYLRVETEKQREQVSLRFTSQQPESVLRECRQAIQRELVEERGWEIKEPHGTGPEDVFWYGIWNDTNTAELSPIELLKDSQHGVGLEPVEAEILQQLLLEENGPTAHLLASDYEQIGASLTLFQENSYTVSVSRPRRSPPEYSDLHLSPVKSQRDLFTLDSSTETVLSERKEQWREQRQEQVLQELVGSLGTLDDLDTEQSRVENHLNTGLAETYPDLTVTEKRTISELKSQANQPDPVQGVAQHGSQRTSKTQKRVFILLAGVVLLLFGGIAGVLIWGVPSLFTLLPTAFGYVDTVLT
jgi:plasmid stability protein